MLNEGEFRRISEKYKTPVYVFDADEAIERVIAAKELLNSSHSEKKTGLCYSIKANPFLVPVLKDVADKFEVCSPGELSICKYHKIEGDMIIYSGVHKEEEDIREAVEYGAGIITAESVRHYELLDKVLKGMKKKAKLILRLSAKSQFGMSLDDLKEVIRLNRDNENIEIAGIHYFTGTQRTKIRHQVEELTMLKEVIGELRKESDLKLPYLEYGPGLPYPYFENDDHSDTLAPLKELTPCLKEISEICELTVEMGRFLASSCGYYLTKVVDKKSSHGRNWCIVDGGIHHLNYLGQMMGMKIPVIKLYSQEDTDSREKSEWAICGSLCTTNDILVREYSMKEPLLNDLMVFCNTGAYSVTEAMGLFLSRTLPGIVIYKSGDTYLARDFMDTWKINI
ncbi:MAG: alanine racemase [Lachnospiraceae bacterium]|nr:alanine racemase [Lachnospiraceae bacterium]